MPLSPIATYQLKSSAAGTTPLVTPSFTPSNGEVITVTWETFDPAISMTITNSGSQSITARVLEQPGGFNGTAGISAGTVSGSPGSMTVTGTPGASARYSMTVERWSGAQLAATPVTNGATATTGPIQSTLTPTGGAGGVIVWVGQDSQSVDPSTRTYAGSGTDDGIRDDHVGSNGVGYHGYQTITGNTSQAYGLTAPTGVVKWVLAGMEVQPSAVTVLPSRSPMVVTAVTPPVTGVVVQQRSTLIDRPVLTTPRPIVVTAAGVLAFSTPVLLHNPPALVQPAVVTPAPIVVTAPAVLTPAASILLRTPGAPVPAVQPFVITTTPAAAPPASILRRGSLADAPVLTTAPPTVVTTPAPPSPPAATLLRNAPAPAVAPSVVTSAPIVVTAPAPAGSPQALLIRGTLTDPPVLTTASPAVVTVPVAAAPPASILLRNPQPLSAAPATATRGPLLVTSVTPPLSGSALLLRSPLASVFVPAITSAQPIVVTLRTPPTSGAAIVQHSVGGIIPPTPPTPPAAVIPSNGWFGLLGILKESRIIQKDSVERDILPISCPNDGEILSRSVDGILYCKYDGFVPEGQALKMDRNVGGGEWGGIRSVIETTRADGQQDRLRRNLACPHDGEPYSRSIDGILYCPFDGYIPPQGSGSA